MARREAFHQHVEGGLARAVELPEASVSSHTAELRGHDRDRAVCGHEIFEKLNRAHPSERIGQHHVDEVALVYRGWRLLVGFANTGIDEEHIDAVPSAAFAQGMHGRRLHAIDRFDFEAGVGSERGTHPLCVAPLDRSPLTPIYINQQTFSVFSMKVPTRDAFNAPQIRIACNVKITFVSENISFVICNGGVGWLSYSSLMIVLDRSSPRLD
jgi:hypothetical protein